MWVPLVLSLALTLALAWGPDLDGPSGRTGKERGPMSTEMTHAQPEETGAVRGRLLFGLIPGGRSAPVIPGADTTEVQVSPKVARDVQWEVARRWGVDPDRVHLQFGLVSGAVPERISGVRILGTGVKGHWVALLSPADPNVTPARVRVRAGVERQEPVAARPLTRGWTLEDQDIGQETTVVWGPPRPAPSSVEAGWVVHRPLASGDRLDEPAVRPPDAVRSGEQVEVVWRRGAVAVSLMGVALGSGPVGTEIRVRTESGRQLRGVAQTDGVVVVGQPQRQER